MHTLTEVNDLRATLSAPRGGGKRIGFVPTMGALHTGHISLIEKAKATCDVVISSIFVNPTQFDDPKDLAVYPTSLDADLEKLQTSGCDVVFVPTVDDVYPPGLVVPTYSFGKLEEILEGTVRPGHFRGMAQVVARLLEIVEPDALFMGQKDYQQYLIVKRLVEDKLSLKTDVVLCPIIREEDGLAKSSRNIRLSPQQREDAVELSRTLFWIRDNLRTIDQGDLKRDAIVRLQKVPSVIAVDYVEIADAQTLESMLQSFNSPILQSVVALAAVQMEGVRLIDNVLID